MLRAPHDEAALKGVRVLELSDQTGQYAGKLLADMGADVVKVEPVGGSTVRQIGPFKDDTPDPNGSLTFWHYNTSKRGVTLNLETADGRELFLRLAETADVIIDGYRPGYLPSVGLGYDDIRDRNPRLVFASVTSFGQTGPWRDYIAGDLVHLALGGIMASSGYNTIEDSPPIAPTGGNAYHMGSHIAATAIVAALLHVLRTGQGQYIDQSIHDVSAQTTELAFHWQHYHGLLALRQNGRHAFPAINAEWTYVTADGKYINVLLNTMDVKRARLLIGWMAETGDQEDLAPEQVTDSASLGTLQPHLAEVVGRFVSKYDLMTLYKRAQSMKMPWSPIRAVEDLFSDPQLTEDRLMFHEVEHPEYGRSFTYIGAPYKFSRSVWEIRGRAPLLGEHNVDIFGDELGLDGSRLKALAEAGVI